MRLNKQIVIALVIMIATSALYRVMPGRPYGFAPQIAIALFGGSLFSKQKQYAFLLPILQKGFKSLIHTLNPEPKFNEKVLFFLRSFD